MKGVHVVVSTPSHLAALVERGHVPFNNARFVVIDEADECMRQEEAMNTFLNSCAGKVCGEYMILVLRLLF